MQQRAIPNNTPPIRPRQSPWQIIKSFIFRILMIYFVTRFFRRPATINPTGNGTLPIISSTPNVAYTPGNLYKSGDLLVRIFFFLFKF
jgi:hypothetical protein